MQAANPASTPGNRGKAPISPHPSHATGGNLQLHNQQLSREVTQLAMPTLQDSKILWLFSGILLLEVAVASGAMMALAIYTVAVVFGLRGEVLSVMAVSLTLTGFCLASFAVLQGFIRVARRGQSWIPTRWLISGMLSVPVCAPLWGLCMVFVVEPLTKSEAIRIAADHTIYALVQFTGLPIALGVPLLLARLYRRSRLSSPREITKTTA